MAHMAGDKHSERVQEGPPGSVDGFLDVSQALSYRVRNSSFSSIFAHRASAKCPRGLSERREEGPCGQVPAHGVGAMEGCGQK